jgi:hypothetical protein
VQKTGDGVAKDAIHSPSYSRNDGDLVAKRGQAGA